jgi:hypothetical protein
MTLAAFAAVNAFAAPFTPGNILISRVGDGSGSLTSAATAVFIDEYTPAGVFVQSVAAPTTVVGTQRIITNSGSATSEGYLANSVDGKFVTFVGYDAPVGTASVVGTDAAVVNRVIGLIKADGTIDSSTAIEAYNANNIRSAVTVDGTAFWVGGTGTPASSGGVRYVAFGPGQISEQISSTVTNIRNVKIWFNQLFAGSMSGAFRGVNTVGTGLPTTPGQIITLLPGFDPSTSSPQSIYDFVFTDANTLYLADDRTPANGGGLQKWTFDSNIGEWVRQYTITAGLSGTATIRGLIVKPDVLGNVVYATSTEGSANSFVTLVDLGPSSSFSVLATAPTNTRFRGLAFAPVGAAAPETIAPDALTLQRGQIIAGTIADLATDNNVALRLKKFFVANPVEPFVWGTLQGTTSILSPSSVTFRVKSRMVTGGQFRQELEQWNWNTSSYENLLNTNPFNTVYGTRESIASPATGKVNGSGRLQARIRTFPNGISANPLPEVDWDLVNWIVNP